MSGIYSSVDEVGKIALLEEFTVIFVDSFISHNEGIDFNDENVINEMYEILLDKLNVEHLKSVIRKRLKFIKEHNYH